MPLLFLTSIDDPLIALDGVGAELSNAVLRYYISGTTEQAPVYSDDELGSVISQPIVADSDGEFATIYLDPDLAYRSLLKRADGVLIWDVDPYEIDDSVSGRNIMRTPRVQALVDGVPVPGATMTFYTTETSTKRDTFADSLLETPHPNPITADAGGFFPPIYISGIYRIVPSWTDEIDPYPSVPPVESVADVTVAVLDGGTFGWIDGIDGSVDPDPFSLDGRQVSRLYQLASQWALRFADSNPTMPGSITTITIETSGAPIVLDAQSPDSVLSNIMRWNVSAWDIDDDGEVRTVEFT